MTVKRILKWATGSTGVLLARGAVAAGVAVLCLTIVLLVLLKGRLSVRRAVRKGDETEETTLEVSLESARSGQLPAPTVPEKGHVERSQAADAKRRGPGRT